MRPVSILAAALLLCSTATSYGAPKGAGDTGGVKGASSLAQPRVPGDPGHSGTAPGDIKNDLRHK